MSVIDNNNILNELTKINESLNNININISSQKINSIDLPKYNINNNDNNFLQYQNSALNTINNINKGIDSIYNNIKLIQGNKINSRVLYNISNSTQTFEDN